MDDIILEELQLNGYNYLSGAILDSNGNYLPELELNGRKIVSESSLDFYNRVREQEAKLARKTNAIQEIKNYEADPINNTLSQRAKDFYPAYAEEQHKNGISAFNNVEDFIKYKKVKAWKEYSIKKQKDNILKNQKSTNINIDFQIPSPIYEYPIVLVSSVLIYLIIKRFIK
jgi:hypothetical protein